MLIVSDIIREGFEKVNKGQFDSLQKIQGGGMTRPHWVVYSGIELLGANGSHRIIEYMYDELKHIWSTKVRFDGNIVSPAVLKTIFNAIGIK